MLEKIYISIAIVLLIMLFICIYIAWKSDTEALEEYDRKINLIKSGIIDQKTSRYKSFMIELDSDLKKYGINPADRLALQKLAKKITFEEISGRKSLFKKIFNSAFYGLLQGGATGFVTGGAPGALGGAIIFGTINPVISTLKEISPIDEQLI